ncbi:MAG: hemopexin repeat-containing protein [Parvibaculaceae bacterium]
MSEQDNFRTLASMELRPVFTSLGLPITAFSKQGERGKKPIFDAVLNADASRPNALWLFKGSNYYRYNLETKKIEDGPRPISGNFAGDTLPQLFRSGIHSAAWAGPAFPNLWYVFKDEMFVRVNSETNGGGGGSSFVFEMLWRVDEGPRGILGAFATGVWSAPNGTWLTKGVPVALHGLGSKYHGMIHFFKDGHYVRHNLNTGRADDLPIGTESLALENPNAAPGGWPVPIRSVWKLPEGFERIDHAFYGSGDDEENIYFLSGLNYALYDFRANEVLEQGLIEQKFPAFAQFMGRPQLFLVEDYSMELLIGPPQLGRLIDTRSIGAGSTIKKILVTETHDTSKTKLTKSLLETQEDSTVESFYDKLDENSAQSEGSEGYKYQLNANFHGDASADSLWGGEVNARLNVQGSSDSVRSSVSQSAFKSVQSQVDQAKRGTEQKTYNTEEEISQDVRVFKKEIFEEVNSSDHVRVYEFYEQLQSYATLMVLRRAQVGFSDGSARPQVVELRALPRLLNEVLVDPAQKEQLLAFIHGELVSIADHEGNSRALIKTDGPATELTALPVPQSTYAIQKPDGTTQTFPVRGIIKADRLWIEPTYTITCIQRT